VQNEIKIQDWLFLAAGIAAIVFSRRLATSIINHQNKVMRHQYGLREVRASTFVCILVGIGFVLLSLGSILGLIQ